MNKKHSRFLNVKQMRWNIACHKGNQMIESNGENSMMDFLEKVEQMEVQISTGCEDDRTVSGN